MTIFKVLSHRKQLRFLTAVVVLSAFTRLDFVSSHEPERPATKTIKRTNPAPQSNARTNAPFPRAPWADGESSASPSNPFGFATPGGYISASKRSSSWVSGRYYQDSSRQASPKETRIKTVWEGPTREDEKALEQIQEHQLQFGPEDPRTTRLMWQTAEHLCKIQKFYQAEKLLKELVAALESSSDRGNLYLLDKARSKLSEIQESIRRSRERPITPAYSRYSRWR